jgi:GTP-binding protein
MPNPKYRPATFLLSAVSLKQLPPDHGIEIAFIGHSNAGKSSALNTITGQKKLARVSKTPGRTQAINVFIIDEHRRFIDLPGYGYAKVPKATKQQWQETVNHYLQKRKSLRGLILIMDIRHPLKELDRQLLKWAANCELPVHILLTKADKLKHSAVLKKFHQVETEISHFAHVTLQTFSALTRDGLEEALLQLSEWLED